MNHLVNFGAEYVYHCHILSHEEDDMMRAVGFVFPPKAATGLAFNAGTLTWTDNSISETAFAVQQLVGGVWTEVGRVDRVLTDPNTTGTTESFSVWHAVRPR